MSGRHCQLWKAKGEISSGWAGAEATRNKPTHSFLFGIIIWERVAWILLEIKPAGSSQHTAYDLA